MHGGHPRVGIIAVVSIAALFIVGCGREASLATPESYCAVEHNLDETFERHFASLTETSTMEQQAAAAVAATKDVIESGQVDLAVRLAPEAIRADIDILETAVRKAATGDAGAILSQEVEAADGRIHKYCGFPKEEGGE